MDEMQIEGGAESYKFKLFESILRNISVIAFKTIIDLGVRDLDAFLCLAPHGIPDISTKLVDEITLAQQSIRQRLRISDEVLFETKQEKSSCIEEYEVDFKGEKERNIKSSNKDSGIEARERVFKQVLEQLGTRVRDTIRKHRMGSFERFMAIDRKKISKFKSLETATAVEIFKAQREIINLLAHEFKKPCIAITPKELKKSGNLKLSSNPLMEIANQEGPSEVIETVVESTRRKDRHNNNQNSFKLSIDEEYYQRTLGHSLDYPFLSSILIKTIPDLFNLDAEENDTLWSEASERSLSSLDISEDEWEVLESASIYKNYQLDVLLGISIDYLISSGIRDDTFNTILKSINDMIGTKTASRCYSPVSCADDNHVISSLEVISIYDFRIDSFNVPDSLIKDMMIRGIEKWGDLTHYSEKSILETNGITFNTYQFIHDIWRMKYYANLTALRLSDFPLGTYNSFLKMIETYIDLSVRKPRDREIIHGRMGLLEGRLWTLNDLGNINGLTRERVRQIERKHFKKLSTRVSLDKLNIFWITVFEILKLSGGACHLEDLNSRISSRLGWKERPHKISLLSLFELNSDLSTDKDLEIVCYSNWGCLSCPKILSALKEIFTKDKVEKTISEIRDHLISKCRSISECVFYKSSLIFSEGFLHFLVGRTDDLIIEDDVIYSSETWGARRGSYTQLAESILKQAGRVMHFSEVHRKVKDILPEGKGITDRNVHTWLTHSDRILLWDRGTFIHCDCISIPGTLIEKIEKWLIVKLAGGIPFIEVSGTYENFKVDCDNGGITSETALYTCLRRIGNPKLYYPRYPQIYLSESYESRMPAVVALEQYIHDFGNSISYESLKDYALRDLCLKPFKFYQFLNDSPHIIKTKSGDIVSTNAFEIDRQKLNQLKEYITNILLEDDHVSINKIFNDKRITCKMLGIDDPKILYQLLKSDSCKNFDLTSYPKVCRINSSSALTKDGGVISQVAEYIKQKSAPCSFDELESYFVDRLGYSENTVYAVTYRDEVFRFTQGTYIHKDTIGWTNDKQLQLEAQAFDTFTQASRAGRVYAFVNHLLEHSGLPRLDNNIIWTKSLLCDLLTHGRRFKLIGNTQNIYVSIPNEQKIQSFEDLLYKILSDNYDGAANLDAFEEEMRNAGVIKKKITPALLGDQKKVCIDDQLIMLKELSKGA